MLPATSANQRLPFGLHLLYATGLRLSELVAATVDDLQWVGRVPGGCVGRQRHAGLAAAGDRQGTEAARGAGAGRGVGALPGYLVARGLDADPENIGNQGAHLLGKASDAALSARRA
jgi:hypothetical protein